MKYVIFKHKDLYMPVIFPDHVIHSSIKIDLPDTEVVSAGFFKGTSSIKTYGESTSLNLGPHERDAELISLCLNNMSTSFFMDWEAIQKRNRDKETDLPPIE